MNNVDTKIHFIQGKYTWQIHRFRNLSVAASQV
jgi:hypothetical protein